MNPSGVRARIGRVLVEIALVRIRFVLHLTIAVGPAVLHGPFSHPVNISTAVSSAATRMRLVLGLDVGEAGAHARLSLPHWAERR